MLEIVGAQYPFQLQGVIDHAERFRALLASEAVRHRAADEVARVWLVGRVEEIETVIGTLIADWQGGRLPESAAVAAISSYLAVMHAGAERYAGVGPDADCCRTDRANTISLTPYVEDPATADTLPGSPSALAESRGLER